METKGTFPNSAIPSGPCMSLSFPRYVISIPVNLALLSPPCHVLHSLVQSIPRILGQQQQQHDDLRPYGRTHAMDLRAPYPR